MAYVIAVDPGLTGAIAVLHERGALIEVIDMPVRDVGEGFVKREVNALDLAHHVSRYVDRPYRIGDKIRTRAVMERVTAMPGQGVASMLSLGDSRGCVRGVLQSFGVEVEEVLPARWKRDLSLLQTRQRGAPKLSEQEKREKKAKAKADSVALARTLFPAFASLLSRAKDHGRAEAMLIGSWATMGRKGLG